ncbi:TPA: site-specific DNA-methyltransferase [Pseudomonas aeruginosa]|uniref:site-specific DNA-methyltransferase n=1 Tax=Pseudomonas aeruginosa TaxID=287 RepID=UPI0018D3CDDD|nr:site-specific DNA-methyltransferase [Pseudomonas aeruginosa]MBH1401156.1 site-specific DNA-methyltransferase [Stenotrophomonas maltophilia]MBW5453590.1 site-specific DNA-methyltransferase [Pseudomonas aeruginosa]HCE6740130.1 site-specific DNA-methyltransferase [Pseudomonas aeruginosa]HCG0739611.1 site-specific DNA-methyltransferase [Pseudomonas aeruginosa]
MEKLTAASPEAQSADLVAANIEQLKALFPELITEGVGGVAVNVDVLKALVGDASVTDADEKYGLNWHGKRRARQLALTPSTGTLRPCLEDSVDWNTTQNLMIEGDNLEVLKLLQKSYAGKVKLIYIDPPYNTGKDFVYPDNFQDNIKNYLELTGQIDGGQKISSNTEASGRFHTDWLNMIYPRLKVAKSLLKKDGVVFISIDDNELHNLRMLADEIFGEENFVATVSVVNNMKGRNDKKHIAACHEYVVIYANPGFVSNGLPLTEAQRAAFKYEDENGQKYALRDLRKRGGPDRREDRPKMYFPIYWDETTGVCSLNRKSATDVEIFPLRGDGSEGCWRWGYEKVEQHLDWMHAKRSGRSGRLDVDHRVYLDPSIAVDDADDEADDDEDETIERTSKPKSVWFGGEFSTDSAKRALKELIPGESFDFPKSIDFLRTCVLLGSSGNDIVADLFAGSAAAGQAVMQQNAIDGSARRILTIQLPEPLNPAEKSQKAAAAVCDKLGLKRNIAELTKERLRRAGAKVKADNPLFVGDTGFRVFKLDTSNIRAWNPKPDDLEATLFDHQDHLLEGRSEADVLYELLLKLGLDLCVPIEQRSIEGLDVHAVGGGVLLACLAEKITREQVEPLAQGIIAWHKELAPAGPAGKESTCVFRDSAFADDVAKTNLAAILEQHGIQNVRSL